MKSSVLVLSLFALSLNAQTPTESRPATSVRGSADQSFALQAGLWKVTMIMHPRVTDEDESGLMSGIFKINKVYNLCLSGKPEEDKVLKTPTQQGCTITIHSTSATSQTEDFTCTTMVFGINSQMIMHYETTLIDKTHASTILQMTQKGIGKDSVMDGQQIWTFLNKDCGGLKPGDSEDQ